MSKAAPLPIPLQAVPYNEKTAQETLQKIMKDFDPKAYIHKEHGYFFCMSTVLKGNRIINHRLKVSKPQVQMTLASASASGSASTATSKPKVAR